LVPVQNKKQYVGICTACVYPNGYLHKEVRMNTFQEIPVLFHEKYWQTSLETPSSLVRLNFTVKGKKTEREYHACHSAIPLHPIYTMRYVLHCTTPLSVMKTLVLGKWA
jgi:hypothetical protein